MTRQYYKNIYDNDGWFRTGLCAFDTRAEADKAADESPSSIRVLCVRVTPKR